MKISFLAWVLQGIPEILGLYFLARSIATYPVHWRNTLIGGLILSILIYVIRFLPFTVGVHSLLAITFLSTILILLEKMELVKSVVVSILTFFLLFVFEFIFNTLIISLGWVTDEQINTNVYIWIVTGYPQIIYLFLLALINNKYYLLQRIVGKLIDKRSVVK